MNSEWDREKVTLNLDRHGVTFEEAATAFADPLSRTILDPSHSEDEHRFILVGLAASGRLLVIVHTDRDESIRLISARPATRRERHQYEQESQLA
jgi:uncharacterized DUF497 family protein